MKWGAQLSWVLRRKARESGAIRSSIDGVNPEQNQPLADDWWSLKTNPPKYKGVLWGIGAL